MASEPISDLGGALAKIEEGLTGAINSRKFMNVTWYVDQDDKLRCHRTTWQFPTARFDEAIKALKELIDRPKPLESTPLPLASIMKMFEDAQKKSGDDDGNAVKIEVVEAASDDCETEPQTVRFPETPRSDGEEEGAVAEGLGEDGG